MKALEDFLVAFSDAAWGMPLLILLMGGGFYFMFYSGFLPFRYLGHAVNVIRGRYDDPNDPGDINHFEALSSALAATVGMGNISGVAVAIAIGGPGVLFWMWVSAFVGMATKFFTCSLSVMYRGRDSNGHIEGGPMYVVLHGLGQKWKPLAVFFSVAGLFGTLPIFTSNQLTQVIREVVLVPNGVATDNAFAWNLGIGVALVIITSLVIFGGIKRIGHVASRMVPSMVVLYMLAVLYIMAVNYTSIPAAFALIFTDAFTANSVLGGAVGAIIIAGARRASFSNEAGIGTADMMHGAARTDEPIREGVVAMLGPLIDTIVVCTLTGLAIIVTGTWMDPDKNGVSITAHAFDSAMPTIGNYVLVLCVLIFAFTSLFSYSYYGTKCFSFLFGAKYKHYYNYFYVMTIIFGATASVTAVLALIDGMYAMMAIPTMVSGLLLSPKVKAAAKDYFKRMKAFEEGLKEREAKKV
ncbi:alanine/glycine:cation symporter family protein [Pontibacter chinhatensis]|uniref:Alanine or glycine:cation symporter, AGCS family n=1 Tax=Pontibacter chinhatensis TaxID=1436961 RepID=A0A1I2TE59_9BACT|nr:alanine/glycine:cation symporter family protein [Pontibacter chinhatensis]SFG63065.1 alanine or glycine:cation symporter, AGCS family [Pontibacter chinhatensis]